tara:strand:+ start:271 stop:561 length:291 start_codon:yes stop_codon:yes gene_type:complete
MKDENRPKLIPPKYFVPKRPLKLWQKLSRLENKKMREVNLQEEVSEYELIDFSTSHLSKRKYPIYRLTEEEAQGKNQAYALNQIQKRFVKLKSRFN